MNVVRSNSFPANNALFIFDANSGDFRVAKTSDFLCNFSLEIAKGNISGHSFVNKFGRNDAVGTTAEDIWSQGGGVGCAYLWGCS